MYMGKNILDNVYLKTTFFLFLKRSGNRINIVIKHQHKVLIACMDGDAGIQLFCRQHRDTTNLNNYWCDIR